MTEPKKHLPCWRYKYGQIPKIIKTEAELQAAAAEGWVDHPVDFAPVPEKVTPVLKNGDIFTIEGKLAGDGRLQQFVADDTPISLPEAPKPKRKRRKG